MLADVGCYTVILKNTQNSYKRVHEICYIHLGSDTYKVFSADTSVE